MINGSQSYSVLHFDQLGNGCLSFLLACARQKTSSYEFVAAAQIPDAATECCLSGYRSPRRRFIGE